MGRDGFEVEELVDVEIAAPDFVHQRFRFERSGASGPAELRLDVTYLALSTSIRLDDVVPLERVRVGALGSRPARHAFGITLRDRHGYAWSDADGDGRSDLFIGRGGLKGKMAQLPLTFADELMLWSGEGFQESALSSQLLKAGCRDRQVAWIDVDVDGRLDLLISSEDSPNQLWLRQADGGFREAAGECGWRDVEDGLFAIFDAELDGDADVFVAGETSVLLFENDSGRLVPRVLAPTAGLRHEQAEPYRHSGRPIPADFDRDGDVDVLVASLGGSVLFVNEGGDWSRIDPQSLGIRPQMLTANWVDLDNDGLLDLHSVPWGLFLQTESGQFTRPRGLRSGEPPTFDARTSWFDMDGDGLRDLAMARRAAADGNSMRVELHRNRSTSGHWLALRLVGPPGNREAIGSTVIVEYPGGRRVAQPVGGSEGSHFSQGHYRLYFGLGERTEPPSISVHWAGGARQQLVAQAIDTLLHIEHPGD